MKTTTTTMTTWRVKDQVRLQLTETVIHETRVLQDK